MEEVSDYPITTRTNLLRTVPCMVVSLAARPKMGLVTEPAAKWQPDTRAIHAVLKNLDTDDFPVSFDLPFYELEWHGLILPRPINFVQQNFYCRKVLDTVKQRRASVRA